MIVLRTKQLKYHIIRDKIDLEYLLLAILHLHCVPSFLIILNLRLYSASNYKSVFEINLMTLLFIKNKEFDA